MSVRTAAPTAAETLNESPSEKEGKSGRTGLGEGSNATLNESPSEKEGKSTPKNSKPSLLTNPQ